MKNSITVDEIKSLIETAKIEAYTIFDKCTVVAVQLENGFIITESSACVDPANYSFEIGKEICLKRIENKLWELEGYTLQKRVHSKLDELLENLFIQVELARFQDEMGHPLEMNKAFDDLKKWHKGEN